MFFSLIIALIRMMWDTGGRESQECDFYGQFYTGLDRTSS